ncbi:MAG TPA: hypothetical protein VGM63_17515 [Mucilaginibacter sp.]|jgi:hypothetical protein
MESNKLKGQWRKLKGLLIFCLGSCFLLLGSAERSEAQTFGEWFNQKETLIKYLLQQIAAVAQYSSYVKQGYQISRNGLGNIGAYIKDEHGLHSAYYSSLRTVNPEIKDNPNADTIISYAAQIPGQFDHLKSLAGLDAGNRKYIARVEAKVLAECDEDLAELQLVLTSGQAQMSDDERINRLDQIYVRVKDKCAFTQAFCNNVRTLSLQRNLELQDIQSSGRYYESN